MSKISIDKLTLAELKDLRGRVQQAITEREATERAALKEKMAAMAADAGLSIDEVLGRKNGGKSSRGPVPIKYRNPKDATQTWTGRGRMPTWMSELMKKGAKKDSFLV